MKIGDKVKITYKPEYDEEYRFLARAAWAARAANNGLIGVVTKSSDSHGLCFEVRGEGIVEAWYECALDINHEGDHNTAADGSGDSFPNFAPDLAALCARRDRLRARFASYNGGDRPMSPPVALIRELAEVEAQIEAAKDATPDAPHTHPLSPEDEARGFVPAWTADKPHTMAAPSKRPKTHALKARLAGVTCPSCGAPLALCECPTNRG